MTQAQFESYVVVRLTQNNPNDFITPQDVRESIFAAGTYVRNSFLAKDVNGNIFVSGSVVADNSFQLNGKFLATPQVGSNGINGRVISNSSGTDGMYLGYANNLNEPTRIYDGSADNYIRLNGSQLSTFGFTKFLFGNQADDGTFAQFSGSVRMKSGFSSGGNGSIIRNTNTTNNNTIGDAGVGGSLLINTASLSSTYNSGFGIDGTYAESIKTSIVNLKALGVNSPGEYFGDMAFHTSSNLSLFERVRILGSNGNVGIGTATPTSRLHLNQFQQSFATNLPSGALVISDLAGGNLALELGSDATTSNYIQSRNITNATSYSLLLNPLGGNVGIGTTNPTSKLQVVGLSSYSDNETAKAAGLTVGAFYRTSTGVVMVVF